MNQSRQEVVAWVGSNIVPHEADLRARLRRMAVPEEEISEIVQDTYVRIAQLDRVSHIENGRAYFFTAARSILLQRIRRDKIVRIDAMTEMEALALADDDPGPERRVGARIHLEHVRALINALPEPCREIFELRRVHGVPQRDIAERLGIPEHKVEADSRRGLTLILRALSDQGLHPLFSKRRMKEERSDNQHNG